MPNQAPEAQETEEHYARQAALAVLVQQAARKAWLRLSPADVGAWSVLSRPLLGVVAAGQYAAAVDAGRYVTAAARVPAVADLVPAGFAGVASDGRSLVSLLDQPRITTLTRIGQGMAAPQAMHVGLAQLETIAVTQVQDAGRTAAGVAIVARPRVAGYVRYLNPPSCSRCAVLAGQFYRWNRGFLRHPRCDCRHRIVTQEQYDGGSYRDPANTPQAYFDSLPTAEQNRVFTNAGAQAIRDGADLTSVVNARRGMYKAGGQLLTRESTTRRGVMRGSKEPRLMPEAIFARAGDNRDEALRLLERHGYVRPGTTPTPPPKPTASTPPKPLAPKKPLVESLPLRKRRVIEDDTDAMLDLSDDYRAVNPGHGKPGYNNNCVHVVNALELRRRGFDATATPLPESMWAAGGRSAHAVLRDRWTTPDGGVRDFDKTFWVDLPEKMQDWPEGARGWVIVIWKDGGSHIFTVERTAQGGVTFVDGQVSKRLDSISEYGQKAETLAYYVRVDDLTPKDEVLEFVNEEPPA